MKHYVLMAFMVASAIHSAVGQCIKDLKNLEMLEKSAPDYDVPREYTLCTNTVYRIGTLDINMEIKEDFLMPPIRVRPNVHIKCGDDGVSSGNCQVFGGSVQVDATDLMGETMAARNVTFEGLTFADTKKYSIWGTKEGNITFIDCAFKKNRFAEAPVLADYYKPEEQSSMLEMTFIDCIFDVSFPYFDEFALNEHQEGFF